jgi:3-deoxy-7-phosphoheptulonate synthase
MRNLPDNRRIHSEQPLIKPKALINKQPLVESALKTVEKTRQNIRQIIQGKDDRLLVIVGPCSIHDPEATLHYAEILQAAASQFAAELCIIMRVYFEKPRTAMGWKGLISDPWLDQSYDVNYGLMLARKLLIHLNQLGLPAGTEFLDTLTPHYLSDLIAWCAIGARTVESQTHRELASGLPMPVGFKNNTDGNIKAAIDAVIVAQHSNQLLGITRKGVPSIIRTLGNPDCHIILRGSNTAPNYAAHYIEAAAALLRKAQLIPRVMIDCSHGNSMKDYQRQGIVIQALVEQLNNGSEFISGIMLESNLIAGKQALNAKQALVYGQSITDGCLSWKDTLPLLEKIALAVRERRQRHSLISV